MEGSRAMVRHDRKVVRVSHPLTDDVSRLSQSVPGLSQGLLGHANHCLYCVYRDAVSDFSHFQKLCATAKTWIRSANGANKN